MTKAFQDPLLPPMQAEVALGSILKVLNEAVKADELVMRKLSEHRLFCNQEMTDHATIVCIPIYVTHQQGSAVLGHAVGLLGILNGIVTPLTGMRVAGSFNEHGHLVNFVAVTPEQST